MNPTLLAILSIGIPSAIALVASWIGATLLRRSNRESNQNTADANDTNAFKVVTDQLFADNAVLRGELGELRGEVKELKELVESKDVRNAELEGELEDTNRSLRHQVNITRQLANYIKRLISQWPATAGPPPAPEPPIDWRKHLDA